MTRLCADLSVVKKPPPGLLSHHTPDANTYTHTRVGSRTKRTKRTGEKRDRKCVLYSKEMRAGVSVQCEVRKSP